MPRPIARAIARGAEWAWRGLRLSGRPPATREAINLVGSHHRVPTARARFELGWAPRVGYEQGLDEIAAELGV
jgi:nucleoside-diphosphate-sugar epimerase